MRVPRRDWRPPSIRAAWRHLLTRWQPDSYPYIPLMLWYTQIKKFRWVCCDLKWIAPLEVAIEVAFAVEMRQQPAMPFVSDEQRVPGLFPAHIQRFIADKATRHTRRHRALKPLVHELVEIVQRHHLQTGFWIAEKHRVWTFAKVG